MEELQMLPSAGLLLWARPSPSQLHSRMSTKVTSMESEVHYAAAYCILHGDWFCEMCIGEAVVFEERISVTV